MAKLYKCSVLIAIPVTMTSLSRVAVAEALIYYMVHGTTKDLWYRALLRGFAGLTLHQALEVSFTCIDSEPAEFELEELQERVRRVLPTWRHAVNPILTYASGDDVAERFAATLLSLIR